MENILINGNVIVYLSEDVSKHSSDLSKLKYGMIVNDKFVCVKGEDDFTLFSRIPKSKIFMVYKPKSRRVWSSYAWCKKILYINKFMLQNNFVLKINTIDGNALSNRFALYNMDFKESEDNVYIKIIEDKCMVQVNLNDKTFSTMTKSRNEIEEDMLYMTIARLITENVLIMSNVSTENKIDWKMDDNYDVQVTIGSSHVFTLTNCGNLTDSMIIKIINNKIKENGYIRCNKCYKIFQNEDTLISINIDGENVKCCDVCKSEKYLMEGFQI